MDTIKKEKEIDRRQKRVSANRRGEKRKKKKKSDEKKSQKRYKGSQKKLYIKGFPKKCIETLKQDAEKLPKAVEGFKKKV